MKHRYSSPFEFYSGADYPLLVGENIDGDTIRSLEEWNSHPNKDEIMRDAMRFKAHLRTLKEHKPWFHPMPYGKLGRVGMHTNTPVFRTAGVADIADFVRCFEDAVNGAPTGTIPEPLAGRAADILSELKHARYSKKYVYCHNALYYRSFVLRDGKLIGIKNWQYAGFYPPEFEDIVCKYL